MAYKKYIESIKIMSDLVSSSGENEVYRYSESDIYWAKNKNKNMKKIVVKKGEVCQFEFGKNYVPEMSYEHRGLVIGVNNKLLYVLPICSLHTNNKEHLNAYHPIDNPVNSNFYLLKACDFEFIRHDSVLKLNDLRTVSIARRKYKQGSIIETSDTFNEICRMAFAKCFPTFSYAYDRLLEENDRLKKEILAYQIVEDTAASTRIDE